MDVETNSQEEILLLPTKIEFSNTPKDRGYRIPGLRYYVLLLGTLCASLGLSCHFAFIFGLTCKNPPGVDEKAIYDEDPGNSTILYFNQIERSLNIASYPIGNIIMLPLLPFLKTIPMRYQVTTGVFIAGVLTIAFPFVYNVSTFATVILKVVHGMATSPTIPLVGHLGSHWAPKAQIGLFIGLLTCFSQISMVFTMGTSGVMCELYGWRSLFYYHGVFTVLLAVTWFIMFRDDPAEHPWLSNKEYQFIREEKTVIFGGKKEKTPFKTIFASMGFWAVIIAAIGNYNGISPLFIFSPVIMRKGLGISELQISYFNGASSICQAFFKILSGHLSDKLKMAEKTKLGLFNTLSCGLCGVAMIFTAFFPMNWKISCGLMIAVTQAIIGFNSAGFNKAAIVVMGIHAPFIMTMMGIIVSVSTIIEPFVVAVVAPENTWSQWFPLLVGHGAILIFTNFIFCLFTDGKPIAYTIKQKESSSSSSS